MRRWTRAEFYRLAELGMFQGQRAELIEGDIMVLSPQNWPHASTVDRAAEVLRRAWSACWVRAKLPLNLGRFSDPEPDVSVVPGRREDYTDHPTTALLIVEVSDTTLTFDRTRKASLYATAGLADYWVINLVDNQVEVYRQPCPDLAQDYGHGYQSKTVHSSADRISPLAAPTVTVACADLLN